MLLEDAYNDPHNPNFEAQRWFMGGEISGGVNISSTLRDQAAKGMEAEARIAKEKRKIKEERTLAKAPKGGAPPTR